MKDDNLTVTVPDTGAIEETAEVSPQKLAPNRADATPFQLMSRRFHRHRIAVYAGYLLIVFYLVAIFCEFIAPLPPGKRNVDYLYAPPQPVRIFSEDGRLRPPFVYGLIGARDPETAEKVYSEDLSKRYSIKFLPSSEPYHLWGVLPMSRKLFGVEDGGTLYLLGADSLGRDLFSRICYGARISLSIGLVGVAMSFALGLTLGSISGFYGGAVDNVIQRTIEVIQSFPNIPLWMALAAALPSTWSPLQIYFGITVVLSLIGWTGLARQVRGKILALREEDFCTAALLAGVSDWRVMWRHLLPSFVSHIIVTLTLAIPSMILAETALSFLGLGLQPPVTSWGVLLTEAQNVQTVAIHPWLLTPVVLVIMTVLAFNFLGDGMRDAADPHA